METNYFEIFKVKENIEDLEYTIEKNVKDNREDRKHLQSGTLVNRMIRNRCRTRFEKNEELRKLLNQYKNKYQIELLAFDDMKRNLNSTFIPALYDVLHKKGIELQISEGDKDIQDSLKVLSSFTTHINDLSFAKFMSDLVDYLFSIKTENGEKHIELIEYMSVKEIKNMYMQIMNDLYKQSLNYIYVDYMKNNALNQHKQGMADINSIPAGI